MRFSNPSPAALEKGRLFGSAQMRSSCAAAGADSSSKAISALRQAEDIERPPLGGPPRQLPHQLAPAIGGAGVARVEVVGDDAAGPAADAGEDGDVLVPIRPAIGRGLADDPAVSLELPQHLAGAGMHRLEPAFHVPVEDEVAGSGDGAAPDREFLADRPEFAALHDVPGGEFAAMPAGARHVADVGADIGRTGDVIRLDPLV